MLVSRPIFIGQIFLRAVCLFISGCIGDGLRIAETDADRGMIS